MLWLYATLLQDYNIKTLLAITVCVLKNKTKSIKDGAAAPLYRNAQTDSFVSVVFGDTRSVFTWVAPVDLMKGFCNQGVSVTLLSSLFTMLLINFSQVFVMPLDKRSDHLLTINTK